KERSFWDITEENNDSCTWKAILELRNKVRPFFVHTVGKGKNISMWNDNWCTLGNLKKFISNIMLSDARIEENCSIADMIENDIWNWPPEWDTAGKMIDFSVKNAWWDLRDKQNSVSWWKIDRIMKWNPSILLCPLCNKVNDSHDHLFFKCDYSNKIWGKLNEKMNVDSIPKDWRSIIEKVAACPCNNAIRSVLRRIVLATTIYYIWRERNSRIFADVKMSTVDVLKKIVVLYQATIAVFECKENLSSMQSSSGMECCNEVQVDMIK
ncbi:hypothetical protein Tco_0069973, partial [Tanacetum coccineum]